MPAAISMETRRFGLRGGLGTRAGIVAGAFLAAASVAGAADLADAAARIEYGFYADQPALVRAAAADLERAGRGHPEADYLLGLAALRLAELDADGRDAEAARRLGDCVAATDRVAAGGKAERERGRPHGGSPRAVAEAVAAERAADAETAEALVLGAACEAELARREPLKGLLHERRRDQDLERARRLEPGNPRAALVAAWVVPQAAARTSADRRKELESRLEAAIAAFDGAPVPVPSALPPGQPSSPPAAPGSAPASAAASAPAAAIPPDADAAEAAAAPGRDWGEPEALAQLGELRLLDGRTLEARDLIERALLAAPDYRFALQLKARLPAGR